MSAHPLGSAVHDGADLRRLIAVVDLILGSLPEVDHRRYGSHQEHRKAAEAALDELTRTEGARWKDRGTEHTVTLGGLRASSTGGAAAALQNWRTAALAKIGGAA